MDPLGYSLPPSFLVVLVNNKSLTQGDNWHKIWNKIKKICPRYHNSRQRIWKEVYSNQNTSKPARFSTWKGMTYHNHTNLLCQPTLQNNQINAIKEKNMSFVFIFPSLSATNKFFTWPERGAYSSDETSCKAADYFSSCFRRARFFSPNGSDIYIYILYI